MIAMFCISVFHSTINIFQNVLLQFSSRAVILNSPKMTGESSTFAAERKCLENYNVK